MKAQKNPRAFWLGGLGMGAWQCPTFAWGSTLSSARGGFTSEVGMGSGGSRPPWPPGNSSRPRLFFLAVPPCRGGAFGRPALGFAHASRAAGPESGALGQKPFKAEAASLERKPEGAAPARFRRPLGCCMAKPHGQLVPVSCTRCRASTPGLSTWWSSRALQGALGPREASSWEGLPA